MDGSSTSAAKPEDLRSAQLHSHRLPLGTVPGPQVVGRADPHLQRGLQSMQKVHQTAPFIERSALQLCMDVFCSLFIALAEV